MDILTAIAARRSVKADQLIEPAPRGADLEAILQAAMSAPDHGGCKPWRFLVIDGAARNHLGELFVAALKSDKPDSDAEAQAAIRAKASRSPLILAVIASTRPHPKVPDIEQILTVAMGAENMLLAAQAMGYGGVLLTGANAYHPIVRAGLGLGDSDQIVGFLYLGTPKEPPAQKARPNAAEFTRAWTGLEPHGNQSGGLPA